jgi:hypothetical protein
VALRVPFDLEGEDVAEVETEEAVDPKLELLGVPVEVEGVNKGLEGEDVGATVDSEVWFLRDLKDFRV